MHHLITFVTDKFDPSAEPPNEFNPIPGKSILDWLRTGVLGEGFHTSEVASEDWGWYMIVEAGADQYMIGGTCFNDNEEPPKPGKYEWLIQISKERSIADWFLRRNKLEDDDALSALIYSAVNAETTFSEVRFERANH